MAFEELLGRVYSALAQAPGKKFESVFLDNDELTAELYDRSGLSGATFVVADSKEQRFILLQHGVKDAEKYDVRLQLPIRKASGSDRTVRDDSYNRYCNRIFQIQRKSQGLGRYQSRLLLSLEPEFLGGLPNEFVWSPERSDDWIHVPVEDMYRGLLAWRWLHWLILEHGPHAKLGTIKPEIAWTRKDLGAVQVNRYFSAGHLGVFDAKFADDLPEHFIPSLDNDENWSSVGPDAEAMWLGLRKSVDTGIKAQTDFSGEFKRLTDIYGPFLAETGVGYDTEEDYHLRVMANLHDWLQSEIAEPATSLEEALVRLHARVKFPIPSYFYFSVEDGAAKEHLVVPVLRSDTSPLVYFFKNERRSHTAVVCGLASLNASADLSAERRRMRILELKTILRICADRIIDAIFIKGLVAAERERAKEKAETILGSCQADDTKRLYILGSFGKRVTFLAQQSRALMLVRALHEKGLLDEITQDPSKSVAIVGGGIAGVTAAAALATTGVKVTLFEAGGELLNLQAGASHRFIHPKMSTWPLSGSEVEAAGLPLLNWTADFAPNVTSHLKAEFKEIETRTGLITIHPNMRIDRVEHQDDQVFISGPKYPFGDKYPIAIVAIGFGLEKDTGFTPSYWQPDALAEHKVEVSKILVVGDGDGGLIDLARATLGIRDSTGLLKPFNQEIVVRELMASGPFRDLARHMAAADDRYRKFPGSTTLMNAYRTAFFGLERNTQLLGRVVYLTRDDTDVTYGFKGPDVFRSDTALINRVLAFLILQSKSAKSIRLGKVKSIERPASSAGLTVTDELDRSYTFDTAVVRFGPEPSWLAGQIPTMKGAAQVLGGRLRDLELADELDHFTYDWYQSWGRSRAVGDAG